MIRLVAVAAVAGCAYDAGSFAYDSVPFVGHRSTVGCIDIAAAVATDRVAAGVVIDYTFANRCARAVPIDLSSIRVVANNIDATTTPLGAFDPHRELRPLRLDGGATGHESIEYDGDGLALVDPETARGCAYGRQLRATALATAMAQLDATERQIAANGERMLDQARAATGKATRPETLRSMQASIDRADADATTYVETKRADIRAKLGPQPCAIGDRIVDESHAAREVCLELGRIDPARPTGERICLAMRGYSPGERATGSRPD